MIRLRQTIERAREHRWLGFVVLVLLVCLLALLVLHSTGDAVEVTAELACLAIVLITVVRPLVAPMVVRAVQCGLCSRGPPRLARRVIAAPRSQHQPLTLPLRL